ncbi:integral membrane protein [Rhodobacteraceae bacterium KLH11]|nr:integral membrane protein [Rhodobacteraceae bacterium KLH11]
MPLVILAGMTLGLMIGVIPGMTAALGLAIVLPLTFQMDALTALILMTSVYTGSLTGGGILAILINTPGTPGAVATTFDGYPMAQTGRANEALGLQIAASAFGGAASYLVLLFFIQPMTKFALQFQSAEMLALTLFVLVVVGVLKGKYLFRSLFAGGIGLLLATVGTVITTGEPRGTMGFGELEDRLPIVLCVIGLFAVPELIQILPRRAISEGEARIRHSASELWQGFRGAFRRWPTLLRGSGIGVAIGILPAAGATLASILSYTLASRLAKHDERFGEGEPKGVVAAESANNASEGGAMAILLALGIPGSASTAVILGGFMLHGLVPGTGLFRDNGPLIYGLILGNIFQMFLLVGVALAVAYFVARIVTVPTTILVPVLTLLLAVGAYSFRGQLFDVYVVFAFGIIGWFCRRYDFTPLSLMIGLFLGSQLDQEMIRVSILYSFEPLSIFERPIAASFFALTAMLIFCRVVTLFRRKKRGAPEHV